MTTDDEFEVTPESATVTSQISPGGRVIERAEHCISRKSIPENVLKVLYRLHRSGHRAYLCGGSVRDLLMSRTPKDFDIATDAHPTEIRRLFRNSRIIGRRFRLVHIMFQDRIVEVSTFRREPENRGAEEGDLLVTDDNTFGTPLQDARRRDFTINGLFYNIADFTLIDYVGGIEDLGSRLIRVIGEPAVRFQEDPVRMMRAVEFAARLDFEIEANTYDAIVEHRKEILKASAPRVTEEILELLRRGSALDSLDAMVETQLLEPLLPELFGPLDEGRDEYFWTMLEVLDRTVRSGRVFSDAVLLSTLFLPFVIDAIDSEEKNAGGRMRPGGAILLIREQLDRITLRLAVPAGVRHQIQQALETMWRMFETPSDKRGMWRFAFREHFHDALALFELFALSSGRYVDSLKQWQGIAARIQRGEVNSTPAPRRRRRRRQ